METTGSGGFLSLFMCLSSCTGSLTWTANQSYLSLWWVAASSVLNQPKNFWEMAFCFPSWFFSTKTKRSFLNLEHIDINIKHIKHNGTSQTLAKVRLEKISVICNRFWVHCLWWGPTDNVSDQKTLICGCLRKHCKWCILSLKNFEYHK